MKNALCVFYLFLSIVKLKIIADLHIYIKEVIFMEVNELINLIVNNGFPVAVSAYLLMRLEKQLCSLSASINRLNTIISIKLGTIIDPHDPKDDSGSAA